MITEKLTEQEYRQLGLCTIKRSRFYYLQKRIYKWILGPIASMRYEIENRDKKEWIEAIKNEQI